MKIWRPEPGVPTDPAWTVALATVVYLVAAHEDLPPIEFRELTFIGRVDRTRGPRIWIYENVRTGRRLHLDEFGIAYRYVPPKDPTNPRSRDKFVTATSLSNALTALNTNRDGVYEPPAEDEIATMPYASIGIGPEGLTQCELLEAKAQEKRRRSTRHASADASRGNASADASRGNASADASPRPLFEPSPPGRGHLRIVG